MAGGQHATLSTTRHVDSLWKALGTVMGISDQPATGFPASDNPAPIERLTKKDTQRKGRKADRGTDNPRLCGQCHGIGRILDETDGIHWCPSCNGEGIG